MTTTVLVPQKAEDADNEELSALYDNLTEVGIRRWKGSPGAARVAAGLRCCPPPSLQVIELTRELVEADQGASPQAKQEQQAGASALGPRAAPAPAAAAAVLPAAPSLLPPQVAEQIRHAQQRAALAGQGPAAWAIGAKCKAIFAEDGNWCGIALLPAGHPSHHQERAAPSQPPPSVTSPQVQRSGGWCWRCGRLPGDL